MRVKLAKSLGICTICTAHRSRSSSRACSCTSASYPSIQLHHPNLIPDLSGFSGTPHSSAFLHWCSLLLSTINSRPAESSFLGAFLPPGTVVWLFSASCLYPSSSSSYAHGMNSGSIGRNAQGRRNSNGLEGKGGTRSGWASSGPWPLYSSALLASLYLWSFKSAS